MLFIFKPEYADPKEHHGKSEQDPGIGQDGRQPLTAQDDVQQAAHRPGGWQDLDYVLYSLWEKFHRVPAASQQCHHHAGHNAQPARLAFSLDERAQRGA